MFDYKEGVDFKLLVSESDSEAVNIELSSGPFQGVVYSYGKVTTQEIKDKEEAYLTFEYDLIDSNGMEDLESDDNFKNHIGDILVSIIMKNLPEGE
jgi:hypothetical protein